MPQKERVLENWVLDTSQTNNGTNDLGVHLFCHYGEHPFRFSFVPIRSNVFRTRFTSVTHPLPPHPSIPPIETALENASVSMKIVGSRQSTTIGSITTSVDWADGVPVVSVSDATRTQNPLHQDLPHRSYIVDGAGVAHYSRYDANALYVGLGEKAAPMNLAGRKFELSTTDSFGYDVYRTDPLYKHIPLLIQATPTGCIAIFSTSHARGSYSIGAEMDGLWGKYKVYRQDYGGLEEYIIVGKTLEDVVTSYASIAGYPLLVPRWAFGYLSGGMKYSMLDEPRASDALLEFANKLREHDIPCSAYQMSSGYTVSESSPRTRNVFTWNRHRFPDPEGFIKRYHQLGMRLIANVKPYVLSNHPDFSRLKESEALFVDPHTNGTAVARLWSAGGGESGEGGHIDFTSAAGFEWWHEGVKKLRKQGIDGIWNDNNEYTIADDDWICALNQPSLAVRQDVQGYAHVGLWGRSLQTELHGKASHDALVDVAPDERPFVLTRSATTGTLRYACSSWSGDNVTGWAGMKGANALSLTAGICLMQCYGHDIGGFEGPQPSPELLLRWIQLGIYSPRFAINCFKTGADNNIGDVIEPWMYPEITRLVRRTIKRRYALIPFLYSLMLVSHQKAMPPQRWTGWGYEGDPEVWTPELMNGETQYWLGHTLIVGGVFEPGVSKTKVYLPKNSEENEGFLNLNAPYEYLSPGQWATIDVQWHGAGIPVLARIGSALPVGKDVQVLSPGEKTNPANLPLDDYRAVEIFPPRHDSGDKWYETTWYEDDGVSSVTLNRISEYRISYCSRMFELRMRFTRNEVSGFEALWKSLIVILPVGDERALIAEGNLHGKEVERDGLGRKRFCIGSNTT